MQEEEIEFTGPARSSYKPEVSPDSVDFNTEKINELESFISQDEESGSATKDGLVASAIEKFNLEKDGAIYHTDDFAITFSKLKNNGAFGSTVVSLGKIKKYDDRPLIVCATNEKDSTHDLYILNSSMVDKVRHSSEALTDTKIRGSANGSNIIRNVPKDGSEDETIENKVENFSELYKTHQDYGFEGNLGRIVDTTHQIQARIKRFEIDEEKEKAIMLSNDRMKEFVKSEEFKQLNNELTRRVEANKAGILKASKDHPNSSKVRGDKIEDLVISKEEAALNEIPENELGDFNININGHNIKVDIKSKLMNRASNPKGFHVDKYLEFASEKDSYYLAFLVGIDTDKDEVTTRLVPVIDNEMISGKNVVHHFSGREARGTVMFDGTQLSNILKDENFKVNIDDNISNDFLTELVKL